MGLVDLYSATLWDVVKAAVWNFLVCASVYFVRESTGRRNRGGLYWSLGRSLLLLNMLPMTKGGGGNKAAVGLAYVLASEIYAQDGVGKAILLR